MNEQNALSLDSLPGDEDRVGKLPQPDSSVGLTIVRCNEMLYGVETKWIREIGPFIPPTPLYRLPSFWIGLTALRGQLYAILDLRRFLFSQPAALERGGQVLFTAVHNFAVGLLVEAALTVQQVDAQGVTPAAVPEMAYVQRVTSDQIAVLDLPGLLADPRLAALESKLDEAA